jgi:hypothetical protein
MFFSFWGEGGYMNYAMSYSICSQLYIIIIIIIIIIIDDDDEDNNNPCCIIFLYIRNTEFGSKGFMLVYRASH